MALDSIYVCAERPFCKNFFLISTQAPFKAEYGEKETIEDKHGKFLTEVIKTSLEYVQVPISYLGDSYIGKTSL